MSLRAPILMLALCGAYQAHAKRLTTFTGSSLASAYSGSANETVDQIEALSVDLEGFPKCDALKAHMAELVQQLEKKNAEVKLAMRKAVMSLHGHKQTVGVANSSKLNDAESLADALQNSAQDKNAANKAKMEVDLMIEKCDNLQNAVVVYNAELKSRRAMAEGERRGHKKQHEKIHAIKMNRLGVEAHDLKELLAKLQGIFEAKAEVDKYDAYVNVGAAAGIAKAANLVVGYVSQLKKRKELLATELAKAFEKFPELQPVNAKMEIDDTTQGVIEAVKERLQKYIDEKEAARDAAFEKIESLGETGAGENRTGLSGYLMQIQAAGEALAPAEALMGAIDMTVDRINEFFNQLGNYKRDFLRKKLLDVIRVAAYEVRGKAALQYVKDIEQKMALDVVPMLQTYSVMWVHATQAEELLNKRPVLQSAGQEVHSTAVALHLALNQALLELCAHFKPTGEQIGEGCMAVRRNAFKIIEQDPAQKYCDERFTKVKCVKKNGFSPSGRTCYWVENDRQKGIRQGCKTRFSPTRKPVLLQYHQDHEGGAGIFY